MKSIKDDRGYNQGWADSLATRIRYERRCDYMVSKMDVKPGKSIMEIGCGTGENAYTLAKKTGMLVLGTDLCVPFIEDAKKNYVLNNLRYDVLDFNKADQFKGEKFDYIVGNGILHHLYYHLDNALTNMLHLLKDGGKILFFEPNIYNPYIYFVFSYPSLRKKANLEPDEMAFSKSFIGKKLINAGYKSIKVEYKDFLLPGIPDIFITPSIAIGSMLEKILLVRNISQSVFISAKK